MALKTVLGAPDSDSYANLSYAATYFKNRQGGNAWTDLEAVAQEAHLRQACTEIDMNNFQGDKYYESQRLQFPRNTHLIYTGICATPGPSGYTATSFKGSNLWSLTYNLMPTDYWKDGTVHITYGTCLGEIKEISSSNALTGKVTVASAFSTNLAASSMYTIFYKLPEDIKRAQCEQAFANCRNDLSSYKEFKATGMSGVQIGDVSVTFYRGTGSETANSVQVLGFFARKYLSAYLRKDSRVWRG